MTTFEHNQSFDVEMLTFMKDNIFWDNQIYLRLQSNQIKPELVLE